MSILATMFVKLFHSQSSVCLSKGFFAAYACILKLQSEKTSFFELSWTTAKNLSVNCTEHNLEILAILLANTKKALKFHRFDSKQNRENT